jgi:hypothetical protein
VDHLQPIRPTVCRGEHHEQTLYLGLLLDAMGADLWTVEEKDLSLFQTMCGSLGCHRITSPIEHRSWARGVASEPLELLCWHKTVQLLKGYIM